jgi:hypothetical protein
LSALPHGYEVFAIPTDVDSTIARLSSTPPYPDSKVVDILVADWIVPALALVVWAAETDGVYHISEAGRKDTRSKLFLVSPGAYHGTWIQAEISSPNDDALVHGFRHAEWSFERAIAPADFYFARDGRGQLDRVIVTSTIPRETAEALLGQRISDDFVGDG